MKVLMLTRYSRLGASSRMRSIQYLPWFDKAGVQVTVAPLFSDSYVQGLQNHRRNIAQVVISYLRRVKVLLSCREYDVVWVEKEALPWVPYLIESIFFHGSCYILDYDDAIFHNYDLNKKILVRKLLGAKLDRLMAGARMVVGGNRYLAKRAIDAGAKSVEVVPTVVDLDRYVVPCRSVVDRNVVRIVWIGSPSTGKYLAALEAPLAALSKQYRFKLRVIGCKLEMQGVDVECFSWSEESEVESIAQCDIGVMPLTDSPWEKGKCGYKLIQYMAVALPVVASPIGVNSEIVQEGVNGFLAGSPQEWVQKLGVLLADESVRCRMGSAGRRKVEEEYCIQRVAPRLVGLVKSASMS